MMYILLIIGFFLLIKGADYFVEGSSAIAKLLKVPSVVIGLTIVALGTSAPEAAVSITAGLAGSNDLALSNVIGSNIFNLVLIVGICALIRPFIIDQSILNRDFPLAILSSVILLYFIRDNHLARPEGLILLTLMIGYLALILMFRNIIFLCTQACSTSSLDLLPLFSAVIWSLIMPAELLLLSV